MLSALAHTCISGKSLLFMYVTTIKYPCDHVLGVVAITKIYHSCLMFCLLLWGLQNIAI